MLRLEYTIDYVKKNGRASRKVFQLTERTFPPGESTLQRKQSFQNLSTRKHYPGRHLLRILVNGQEKTQAAFDLI